MRRNENYKKSKLHGIITNIIEKTAKVSIKTKKRNKKFKIL